MKLKRPPSITSLQTLAKQQEKQVSLYATDSPDVVNPENGYFVEQSDTQWKILFGVPFTGGIYQDQIWNQSVEPGNPKRLTEGGLFMSPGFRNRLAFRDLPKPIEVMEVTVDKELNEIDFWFYSAALIAFHTAPNFEILKEKHPDLKSRIKNTKTLVSAIVQKYKFPGDETSQITNFIKQVVANSEKKIMILCIQSKEENAISPQSKRIQ